MQLYFIKATFTNNVYKLSDFFVGSNYNLIATKMLDINFRPDDGLSSFITSKIILPDTTKIWDHTHIIIPEYGKIYRIASIDYVNNDQYNVTLDEDPLIANYKELETKDIILMRTNDTTLFRGVNDISDLTLKETVETKVFPSLCKSGKWALIFMQYNPDKARYGLKFKADIPKLHYEAFSNFTAITTKYPEVTTTTPNLYDYFQKIVYAGNEDKMYQCVYDGSGTNTRLYWVEYEMTTVTNVYFNVADTIGGRLSLSDVRNIVIALPFENSFDGLSLLGTDKILSFNNFVGPIDEGETLEIKIVDDILMPIFSPTFSLTGRVMRKSFGSDGSWFVRLYDASSGGAEITAYKLLSILRMETDIELDPGYITGSPVPTDAEPFKKYELYVFGKKFSIPYYLTDDLHLLIAVNSGVINYLIYYNNKRYILGSGSFTHSMRYQANKLDQFYNQNPTYKDQFFTKMGADAMKTVVGGAVAGSVVPGLGTVAGAGIGLVSAGVDAGLSMINLHYQEKSLKLQPEQIFGEISEVTLQLLNIFGIYFVKRTSENASMMKVEYDMRGFPTLFVKKINTLTGATGIFGTAKIVYGELKGVIRNEFVTGFINNKLKEGIVII